MPKTVMSPSAGVVFTALSVGGVALLAAPGVSWWHWPWLYAYLLAINVWTFACYAYDKAAAGRAMLRVPEAVLHGLTLVGGTPGAWAGQRTFRHKTLKRSFRRVFWVIVAVQAAGVVLWAYYR